MTSFHRLTGVVIISMMIALAGCFSLSRDEPPIEHYVLSTAGGQDIRPQAAATGPTIGVRQVQLAEYLDIPFIIVRRGANRITYSDFHRWGEGLSGGINRALVQRLLSEGRFEGVDGVPWTAGIQHDYLLQIHVQRFEGITPSPEAITGEAHMLVDWQILRPQGNLVLARGTTEHRESNWQVGEYDELVASLERGLIELAADIISAVERLQMGLGE